nr:PCRF domain-containing protein [Miltoncostaea oceani]
MDQLRGDADGPGQDELDVLESETLARLDALTLSCAFGGTHDNRPAILSIRAGAGGADARDWAGQLLRMYLLWAEGSRRRVSEIDFSYAQDEGIRQVVIEIGGPNAYGLLRGESGVHRVSHLSRFGQQGKRQTSFAAVEVIPRIDGVKGLQVSAQDLRVEAYRASGPGGQHRNKTDSAIRITHTPSGISAQASSDRSQQANRKIAMALLSSRLAERERVEHERMLATMRGAPASAGFGQRKRSYILHPYRAVSDHESGLKVMNDAALQSGNLDPFLRAQAHQRVLELAQAD